MTPRDIKMLLSVMEKRKSAVLVSVIQARGSVPQRAGAHMLVTADDIAGTIGGGALEYRAAADAREMLATTTPENPAGHTCTHKTYPLGPALGQCCGGVASLMFEKIGPQTGWISDCDSAMRRDVKTLLIADITNNGGRRLLCADSPAGDREQRFLRDYLDGSLTLPALLADDENNQWYLEAPGEAAATLYLFGAGHIGRAIVRILADTPFNILWVDERAEIFPDHLPDNAVAMPSGNPAEIVQRAAPGAFYLVMTHDHGRDLELCTAILQRGDFAYAGLIGSETKRARFLKQFYARGLSNDVVDRLVCPIGIAGISGRSPGEIALAVAAELAICREAALDAPAQRQIRKPAA